MEFAVGKPADDNVEPAREFPGSCLYKQVEVRQGWQEQQAQPGTHWSTAVCAEAMTGCSSKSMVLVSLLGLLALLLCGTSEGE